MDIRKVRTVFVSPCAGKYEERCQTMKLFLKDTLKSENFKLKESEMRYPWGVNKAHMEALEEYSDDLPLLIFEDDVEWNGKYLFDIPKNADALYLGNSRFGNGKFPFGTAEIVQKTDELFKVQSMRCAHAILYLTKRYKAHMAKELRKANETIVVDVVFAAHQKFFNVFAFENAPFHQIGDNFNSRFTQNISLKAIVVERNITKLVLGIVLILLGLFFFKSFKNQQHVARNVIF
jgi:hypothetical protein